jgi:hypothetical protein
MGTGVSSSLLPPKTVKTPVYLFLGQHNLSTAIHHLNLNKPMNAINPINLNTGDAKNGDFLRSRSSNGK